MKKVITYLLIFVLTISLFSATTATSVEAAKKPITVFLDGKKLNFDVKPELKNNSVMVPYRTLLEAMGAKVYWNKKSGTIRSTRDGETVQLTLFSKDAFVNGKKVKLNTPATISKGRTLVPLRFISENFNGIVKWNQSEQKVTISMDGQLVEESKAHVYLLNKKLSLTPIEIDKTTYIPLKDFILQMDEQTYWSQYGEEINIELADVRIIAFVGHSEAYINDEAIQTRGYPIEKNGTVYVPVDYITELIDGTYQTVGNSIYYNITHSAYRKDLLKIEHDTIVAPKNVPEAKFVGERRLLLSDNPENLTREAIPFEIATLWDDSVISEKTSIDHRVHGWHVNHLGKRIKLGITIENRSNNNTIEVEGLEGITRRKTNGMGSYDVGLPIAKAVISGELSPIRMNNRVVKPNEIETIQYMDMNNKQLIGFLSDFKVIKVSGTGDLDYIVRVVMSQDGSDLESIQLPPLQMNLVESHPRGTWPSSEIEAELPTYHVGSAESAYSISNGKTDNLMRTDNSLGHHEGTIRNPGHFGTTYKVIIPIQNDTGITKTVRVRLSARGGTYNGALKVLDKVYIVPYLRPFIEVANVIDYKVEKNQDVLELEIMHSGGASLPLAIDLITLD